MRDARDDEPAIREFDMRDKTYGNSDWRLEIDVWPYSGISNQKSYSSKAVFLVRAENARQSIGLAEMLAETIRGAHDIWQTRVTCVQLLTGA